jgi:hypothetical protein
MSLPNKFAGMFIRYPPFSISRIGIAHTGALAWLKANRSTPVKSIKRSNGAAQDKLFSASNQHTATVPTDYDGE